VIIAQDERGHIREDKKGRSSIANIIKPLVASREDWERVKAERLQLKLEGRLPAELSALREQYKGGIMFWRLAGTVAVRHLPPGALPDGPHATALCFP